MFVISDSQAPHLLTFLLAALKFGLVDIGEQFFGLYMWQLIEDKANVARAGLPPESAYDFVKARANGTLTRTSPMAAHPSESVSVLLLMAKHYGLDDAVDPYLSKLDHTSLLVFIPDTHADFSQNIIENGRNHNFQVGHGVWTVEDFSNRWQIVCAPQLMADKALDVPHIIVGALCASLVFPDRTPWFLLRPPKEV